MTKDRFASGEVDWRLQHAQSSQSELIWGQEPLKDQKDERPLLVNLPESAGGHVLGCQPGHYHWKRQPEP